jgi:hypothetical protein
MILVPGIFKDDYIALMRFFEFWKSIVRNGKSNIGVWNSNPVGCTHPIYDSIPDSKIAGHYGVLHTTRGYDISFHDRDLQQQGYYNDGH